MPGRHRLAGRVKGLEPTLDEYYAARGWRVADGKPTVGKLQELGLAREAEHD